ncbi:hypothetical protein FVE85_0517 [Porphyridium purpureum]|uniref:Uncharacterized protein n=1 Tax=Porphyridium purpureum TaxID=35688 RepID=A0A5J4Z0B2_PORPP|nr:hypothetical protein FVE85_0517 [Porphyridium purpureum]|eukprot:POR2593..scf208_2
MYWSSASTCNSSKVRQVAITYLECRFRMLCDELEVSVEQEADSAKSAFAREASGIFLRKGALQMIKQPTRQLLARNPCSCESRSLKVVQGTLGPLLEHVEAAMLSLMPKGPKTDTMRISIASANVVGAEA